MNHPSEGWGTQFFGGPNSPVLMEVAVPIWRQADCQAAYTQRIYDTVTCAGSYQGGKDAVRETRNYTKCTYDNE